MEKRELFSGMNYVYEVYKEMSFSKAAKNLFISQPSLSNSVKRIESLIGAPLFDRSQNPIVLTALGEEYIKTCEAIMKEENNFVDYCNRIVGLKSGDVKIGGTTFYTSYVLPYYITKFKEEYPQIHVDIIESNTPDLKNRLLDGSLDLLIDNLQLDETIFEKKLLTKEHLVLAVPKSYPINQKYEKYWLSASDIKEDKHLKVTDVVQLSWFKNEPFLLLSSGNDTRSRADKLFEKEKLSPLIKVEPSQLITAYNLANYGLGIAFVSDSLVKSMATNDDIIYYPLDNKLVSRDVNIYCKKSRYKQQATEAFLKLF